MCVLIEKELTGLSLHVSRALKKSVWGKCRPSKDAVAVLNDHLCLELLSTEHTRWLSICPFKFAGGSAGIWPVNTDWAIIRLTKLRAEKQAKTF